MKLDSTTVAKRRCYLALLMLLFAVEWLLLSVAPLYRKDWALENVLVLIFVAVGIAARRHEPLSRTSYTLIFVFLALHEVGAHYTYSEVPYVEWGRHWLGVDINALFGWQRNHFDRMVHFGYGLLFFYPLREVCLRVGSVRGAVSYILPVSLLMSGSLHYELIEWAAALVFGGDLGAAYLGTQGDEWDGHKDMALASCGTVMAALWLALFENLKIGNRRLF